jgi:hypothetical protein
MRVILLLFMLANTTSFATGIEPSLLRYKQNKQIPRVIEQNVLIALSHYPELENTHIRFVFKQNIKGSIMQAQPVLSSIFKQRKERVYQINISALFKLKHSAEPIHQLPDNILIGWIGHDLGHVMDYETRGKLNLVGFGISYVFSAKYRRQRELVADTLAVESGLGKYIIDTKRFILDQAELPAAYKEKIARIYLSPDAIVEQVRKLEEKKMKAQKRTLGG